MQLNIFAGQPAGLKTLFFTELWERFSYYGMRSILVLFMLATPYQGGLNFNSKLAFTIYGLYTSLVYTTSIAGGYIADNYLGAKLAITVGGTLIALGHIVLTFDNIVFFYLGLILIILGTGLLKPSVSNLVGNLYTEKSHLRDTGFIIFYMGINIGAALSPLVCGFLAQSIEFKQFLQSNGINPNLSWHFGFGAAALGMILGLVTFNLSNKNLPDKKNVKHISQQKFKLPFSDLTKSEINKLLILALLFFFSALFWSIYEQGGASLNVVADRFVDCRVYNYKFPSSFLQTFQAVFIIILAPLISRLWSSMGEKEPNASFKFIYGMIFIGLGIGIMAIASIFIKSGLINPLWLVGCYLLEVIGELCLSPVGLSAVTKLAPLRYCGMILGVWFLSSALGNYLCGVWSSFLDLKNATSFTVLFSAMAISAFVAGFILFKLQPLINKLESD